MATKTTKPASEKKKLSAEQKQQKAESAKRVAAAKKLATEKKKHDAELKKRMENGDTADIYFLSLALNNEVYTSESADLVEAILGLAPATWIKTKAILTVKFNEKIIEKLFFAKHLRRPLVNRNDAIFLAKKLNVLLK